MTLLESCTVPELRTQQCSPLFEESSTPNLFRVTCVCRDFLFSKEYVGRMSEFVESEFLNCDNSIGFPLESYPDVFEYWESVRKEISDRD